VIILSVMMPEMGGWHVLESLRNNQLAREIPVIIQSMVNEREMGDMMHVDAYLVKPADKNQLLATVRSVLFARSESTGARA
jgi:DNA-binding response OmpR family regulator